MKRIMILTIFGYGLGGGVARADPPRRTATADTPDAAAPRALVVHVAPTAIEAGRPVELEAMIDAPFAESLSVRWRRIGDHDWRDAPFERSSAGGWYATIPPATSTGVEYYIRGRDASGAEVDHFASASAPHAVHVDPSLWDRLERLDAQRLGGLRDEVSFEAGGHDFGNRYGIDDRFLRGEIMYTHRMLRALYHVAFGYGAIGGRTPVVSSPDAPSVYHGLNYGFGEIRIRPHPSVFVDGRVALGVSDHGFAEGARGALTFGKPWRSSLSFGGEYMKDLGGSAWVRLQWDTAPPFLMGASIVRTDLPGALIDRAGLYVSYDVAYPVANRVSVKGSVSYGSRDGAAHLGGGFGGAVAF
jgi:hypothetical protein